MKILLPPSETKRTGGDDTPLNLDGLALPSLTTPREQTLRALVDLAADEELCQRVLKLSAKQHGYVADNAALRTAPTMPAVDRYTGVLYDALDASTLEPSERGWLATHVWIHSALWGPVGALDRVPRYRLSAGTSIPGLPPQRHVWANAVRSAMASENPAFILDLRSESYARLGPVPDGVSSKFVRVVVDEGGTTRALNHFNKKAKGLLVRRLSTSGASPQSWPELRDWAEGEGIMLRQGARAGEVELVTFADLNEPLG